MASHLGLVKFAKSPPLFLLHLVSLRLSPSDSTALLSWLDTNPNKPSTDTYEEFLRYVGTTVTKLSLPSTICDGAIIQDFIKLLEPTDLSGVAAVVGGILSQDVLNALGGKEIPIKNWLIFDGQTCISYAKSLLILGEGRIYTLMGDTNGTV